MAAPTASSLKELQKSIRGIVDFQSRPTLSGLSSLDANTLDFDKWRLIHKYLHATPFRTPLHCKRSVQWREAIPRIRDIGEAELLDWVLLQVQVAENLERGIQDMRPRKNGPCHCLLLEYASDRKRKAHAVLRFTIASQTGGAHKVDSTTHATTEDILSRGFGSLDRNEGGHEAVPWMPGPGRPGGQDSQG